ncbi:MAG: hypothetical protein ACFFAN_08950 [Promethearchaeota archaeon]
MDIFDWVKDVEETYKYLIEKAREENLADLQDYTTQQEKLMEEILNEKQEIVTYAFKAFSEDLDYRLKKFEGQYIQATKKVQEKYKENKKRLLNLILERLGLDF